MHGTLSALTLEGLAPLVREVFHSDLFLAYEYLGFYVLPHGNGALVVCVGPHLTVAILDRDAKVNEPCKVNWPLDILTAATRQPIFLQDENGDRVETFMQPSPKRIAFTDICAIVSPDEPNKWGGVIHTCGVCSHQPGHVIDYSQYFVQPLPERFNRLSSLIQDTRKTGLTENKKPVLGWATLEIIAHLSRTFEQVFSFAFYSDERFEVRSSNGLIYGIGACARATDFNHFGDLGDFLTAFNSAKPEPQEVAQVTTD